MYNDLLRVWYNSRKCAQYARFHIGRRLTSRMNPKKSLPGTGVLIREGRTDADVMKTHIFILIEISPEIDHPERTGCLIFISK